MTSSSDDDDSTGYGKESFDFSSIPVYMMEQIMEKFSYKEFATFEGTCQLAQDLSIRNHRLQFPLDVSRILISDDFHCMNAGRRGFRIPIDLCSKMKFLSVEVQVSGFFLTQKICNFLLNLTVTKLFCNVSDRKQIHVDEFLKKAKIQTLILTTTSRWRFFEKFPYDTSNIDHVVFDTCTFITSEAIRSAKACRSLCFNRPLNIVRHTIEYIEKAKKGLDPVIDITFYEFANFEVEGIVRCLNANCTPAGKGYWIVKKSNGEATMSVTLEEYCCILRFRRI